MARSPTGEARRLRRIVRILHALPEAPKYTTSWTLCTQLGEELRTIQRDMALVSDVFRGSVVRRGKGQPFAWAWAPGKRAEFIAWSRP